MIVYVTNIHWDDEDEDAPVASSLQKSYAVDLKASLFWDDIMSMHPEDTLADPAIHDYIVDSVTEKTGWCILGCDIVTRKPNDMENLGHDVP